MCRNATLATTATVLLADKVMPPMADGTAVTETIELDKDAAYDRNKGNSLSCHRMDDDVALGDMRLRLVAMKARLPDREKRRVRFRDPRVASPAPRTAPFGQHQTLSEKEIDAVVDSLYTL